MISWQVMVTDSRKSCQNFENVKEECRKKMRNWLHWRHQFTADFHKQPYLLQNYNVGRTWWPPCRWLSSIKRHRRSNEAKTRNSLKFAGVRQAAPSGLMDQHATWYGGRLGPGYIVLDGHPVPPHKGAQQLPISRPMSVVAKRLDEWTEDVTWCGGRPRPWPYCVRWGPSLPKGHSPQFSAHVYCGQTVARLSYCWALVCPFSCRRIPLVYESRRSRPKGNYERMYSLLQVLSIA